MRKFSDLRPVARIYVAAVVCVGLATALHSIITLAINPIGLEWLVLAALTLLTGSFTIKVPSITARLTVSETFVFASVLLYGTAAGTVTVVLETLVVALWVRRESRSGYRALFNIAASALSIWLAGAVFYSISGLQPFSNQETPVGALFVPLVGMTVVFFASNSWLVAFAVGLERNESPIQIWWKNFTWLSVNYFSGASVAAVIVTYTSKLDAPALVASLVIIVPLLLVSYLTFRMAMGRVEDSNLHLSELNRLYLSTIETLAMAIDAKDQITHGHIRRVQTYAVGLATKLGISDEKLIKAIEAAALLHDMGKLAVPEYILNKPGKLTPAEFEKMKLHAAVGADILSAIKFPYPVVPIVRHHHENWDGTGYPDGLRGTAIPIGARILSVVDCFDALTSDRPYRPRLCDEDAIAILLERRGKMYDPLVVDAFIRVHSEIAPLSAVVGPPTYALEEISSRTQTSDRSSSGGLENIAASSEEMLELYELARGLTGTVSVADAGDSLAIHLRRLVPSALIVLYVYDGGRDEIVAHHCVGDSASLVTGTRIPLGQRLSGWVAANRQTILNSDPVLDLGDAARSHGIKLKSCLSTPLLCEENLVGVLSFYSTDVHGFNDNHRRIVEAAAKQVAQAIKAATELDSNDRRDPVTGLLSFSQFESLLRGFSADGTRIDDAFTLLLVNVFHRKGVAETFSRPVPDEVLRHVSRQISAVLRFGDKLFRFGKDGFVILMTDVSTATVGAVADRIRDSVSRNPVLLSSGASFPVTIEVAAVVAPADGNSVDTLAKAAALKIQGANLRTGTSRVH